MQVLALTQGRHEPSSRFRIRQYIPALADDGIEVVERCPRIHQYMRLPGALGRVRRRYLLPVVAFQTVVNVADRVTSVLAGRGADLVWIGRSFVTGVEGLVGMTPHPRVLDVDDAIWLTTPGGVKAAGAFASRMDCVLAGNDYLAEWYGAYCSRVEVVPTAVDCARFRPRPPGVSHDRFTIGWMGTAGNFPQLEMVRPSIARFLDAVPGARWLVVADRRPLWWPDADDRYHYVRWSAEREVALMQEMDVGLMPLDDSAWTRGKCSYKMLQAMAVGLPVIVSPVGMNRDVLALGDCGRAAVTADEWYDALADYHADETLRLRTGESARAIVLDQFDVPVVAKRIAWAFRGWSGA
jgi:glycosyltransferase involved in cell wall biosynthesis